MADISFNIARKELKIAQIAQLYQLFRLSHLFHIYSHGFCELSRKLMRKNVNNDVSKDSPIGRTLSPRSEVYIYFTYTTELLTVLCTLLFLCNKDSLNCKPNKSLWGIFTSNRWFLGYVYTIPDRLQESFSCRAIWSSVNRAMARYKNHSFTQITH